MSLLYKQALWHRLMIKKGLRRNTSAEKFNTDKSEIERETPETEIDGEGMLRE